MAAGKAILVGWLGLTTLLWSCHPLLYSQSRGVIVLAIMTALLALAGWLVSIPLLVVWSGGLGMVNMTATLAFSGQAPNLWVGLSAGIVLFALLDTSQRFGYLRHCRIVPGVMMAWLGVFLRINGLSVAAGIGLMLGLVSLASWGAMRSTAGLLTITGAAMFVGALALFLRYAIHGSAKE